MKKKCSLLLLSFVLSLVALFGIKSKTEAKVIYTTNERVNAAAEKIIRSCTNDKMTDDQKLYAVYMYLVKNMRFSYSNGRTRLKVTAQDIKNVRAAEQELTLKKNISYSNKYHRRYKCVTSLQGTCYGMSMVFNILANHMGYSAGVVHGKHVTHHVSDHYWSYLVINGEKRYFSAKNIRWLAG